MRGAGDADADADGRTVLDAGEGIAGEEGEEEEEAAATRHLCTSKGPGPDRLHGHRPGPSPLFLV